MQKSQLKERLYFVSDVHAQHNKLINLLGHIDFDSNDLNLASNSGQLVFIGDLIDSVLNCDGEHSALLNQVESLVKSNIEN